LNNEYLNPAEKDLQRAMLLLGNGRAEEAKVIVESVLAARPESALAHRSKAMLQVHESDFNGAEESLLRAIQHLPAPNHSYYCELGEVLIQLGRTQEATDRLTTAIDLMNSSGDTWELSTASLARAFGRFKLGEFEDAAKDLLIVGDGVLFYGGELWNKSRLLKEISVLRRRKS
jgi:tetratricopeptide (TPR) repeat protein